MILIHALVGSNRQLTERWQHSGLSICIKLSKLCYFFLGLMIFQPIFDKIQILSILSRYAVHWTGCAPSHFWKLFQNILGINSDKTLVYALVSP